MLAYDAANLAKFLPIFDKQLEPIGFLSKATF